MKTVIGVDVGGTAIKVGVIEPGGKILARGSLPYDPAVAFSGFADAIAAKISEIARGMPDFAAIGVSSPGYSDPETDVLIKGVGNVPTLLGQSLSGHFRDVFGVPSLTRNDGICAALGEYRYGAGRNLSRIVVATVGTGVGGAVIFNGQILTGADGFPPEFGAITVDPRGARDNLGTVGNLESLASGPGLLRRYAALAGADAASLTVEDVCAAAHTGNAAALTVFDDEGRYLAQAFGGMANVLNLQRCIVGGGVSLAGPLLIEAIRKYLPIFTFKFILPGVEVVAAETGNDAGILGAAAFAVERSPA